MFTGMRNIGGLQLSTSSRPVLNMRGRTQQLLYLEQAARMSAAAVATSKSQAQFTYLRKVVAPRQGRETTGGRLRGMLQWQADPNDTHVRFPWQQLDKVAPHWIVQEIGTGKRAIMRHAVSSQPGNRTGRRVGRTRNNSPDLKIVKSQVGRPIALLPNTDTGIRTRIGPIGRKPVTIQREIRGKHFVREGAKAGHRSYRQQLVAAARLSFGGKPIR